jgi:large subunit ribosomal protein LP0
MNVKKVYDNGSIFAQDVLDITEESIREKFLKSISNMAAISLASGYIAKPAIPHMMANAFKNLASVSFSTDYSFKQADKMKEAAKNAVSSGPAKGGAPAKADKAVVEEKPKEEEADVDMGNMFGEEY